MADATQITMRSVSNEPAGELAVPAGLFDGPVRRHLLYEAVKMQRANRRAGTAATKTRGQVAGGGRKPWRQKGTGRARAGSIRSPIWVGGATVFGPQPRSYAYRMPKSARKAALRSALAARARDGKLIVLDHFEVAEPKTKLVAAALRTLGTEDVLIVIASPNENLERGARNLPRVKVLQAAGANVYDILRHRHLIITQDAVAQLAERTA